MYECDKNQLPYCNVKKFKMSKFYEFWAIDRSWLTLDKFLLFSFSQVKTIDIVEAYIKFGTKLFYST
jgi:hypothetical protein